MSAKFTLNSADWKKIGLGAVVAVVGVLLTYVTSWIANTSFGNWTPVIVAGWSVIANIARKWLAGQPEALEPPPTS